MVPPARLATCAIQGPRCVGQVDIGAPHTFRYVEGWVENRQAGGANTIALRKDHDRWCCKPCVDDKRKGIDAGQTTLPWAGP